MRIDSSARETRNAKRATFNTKHYQLSTNSGRCPETHSLFCPRQVAMFHLIQKTKEKKSRLRFFRSKNIVHELKRMQTRSDKSDLKQHSFLTAHFTAFFGYINEVAYLVESGQLKVLLEKRKTLNAKH